MNAIQGTISSYTSLSRLVFRRHLEWAAAATHTRDALGGGGGDGVPGGMGYQGDGRKSWVGGGRCRWVVEVGGLEGGVDARGEAG